MQKINGYISETDANGTITQHTLFTHDEGEQEQNNINRATAELVFSPEFIPFYMSVARKYNLTNTEALLYGFIRFYLSCSKNKRFYFTDAQISEILDCSSDTTKIAIRKLKENGLIESSLKITSSIGTRRFITKVFIPDASPIIVNKHKHPGIKSFMSGGENPPSPGGGNPPSNNNSNKNNNIYSSNCPTQALSSPILAFEEVWLAYPKKVGKKKAMAHFKASVKTAVDVENIKKALRQYLASERVKNGFVQDGCRWFGNWSDWIKDPESSNKQQSSSAIRWL